MKHDTKLHHWVTLLAQLEEKYQKLFKEVLKLGRKFDNSGSLIDRRQFKAKDIQLLELEQRIAKIKSQIDQY